MSSSLHASHVGAADAPKSILMLHGIYGRGRNWSSIAKSLAQARPDYRCVLLDLPHHGESGAGAHGDTVAGLAADVSDWLAADNRTPSAILGHSFGGKVALALAADSRRRQAQSWIIDSTPEARPPSGSAWDMLGSVRSLARDFASREALVEALTTKGWTTGVAQWMATNLVRGEDAFTWQLDFDVMEHLMTSASETDLWPSLDANATDAPHAFHFVKATQSDALSPEAVSRLESIGPPRVHVHALDGGHWIHAERPGAVVRLLIDHLD